MCFIFFRRISATIIPYVIVLPAGTFPLGINKIVLLPDGIIVPTTCAIRTI